MARLSSPRYIPRVRDGLPARRLLAIPPLAGLDATRVNELIETDALSKPCHQAHCKRAEQVFKKILTILYICGFIAEISGQVTSEHRRPADVQVNTPATSYRDKLMLLYRVLTRIVRLRFSVLCSVPVAINHVRI